MKEEVNLKIEMERSEYIIRIQNVDETKKKVKKIFLVSLTKRWQISWKWIPMKYPMNLTKFLEWAMSTKNIKIYLEKYIQDV